MKHFFKAAFLFLLLVAILFLLLHTSVSYGEAFAVSTAFCDAHAHLSLRAVVPYAFGEARTALQAVWEGLPPFITLLPSLLWENVKAVLEGIKDAYVGEIRGCVTLG